MQKKEKKCLEFDRMCYVVEKSIIKYIVKCVFKGIMVYVLGYYVNPLLNFALNVVGHKYDVFNTTDFNKF